MNEVEEAPRHTMPGLELTGPIGYGGTGTLWGGTWRRDGGGIAVAVRHEPRPAQAEAMATRADRLLTVRAGTLAAVLAIADAVPGLLVLSEHVPGPTLATVLAGRDGLPAAEAWRLAVDLAAALAALHAAGVVHRDLSPANVLLGPGPGRDRHAVLVDLLTDAGESGTPGYRAPEVRAGAAPGAPADVWALATLVVQACREEDRATLRVALAAALDPDPARRPSAAAVATQARGRAAPGIALPDAATLARARLREAARREQTRPVQRRARHRATRPGRRALVGAAALAVVALAVAGWMWARPGPDPLAARVEALVAARDAALAAGDRAALAAVAGPDSPAAAADQALARALGGARAEGLETGVRVRTVRGAVVEADLETGSYTLVAPDGARTPVPARATACVRITLTGTGPEALLERTEPC